MTPTQPHPEPDQVFQHLANSQPVTGVIPTNTGGLAQMTQHGAPLAMQPRHAASPRLALAISASRRRLTLHRLTMLTPRDAGMLQLPYVMLPMAPTLNSA